MAWLAVSSLRFRLMLLVLLALLPARGLGIYTAWEMRSFARAEALQEALRLARIASAAGERLVEGTHQMLVVLARLPEVRSQNAAACSALLATVLKPYPYYSNLAASRPNGETFCSAVPFDAAINVADRAYFRRVLETRDFAAGEYQIGRVTGKAVINFAYPVLNEASQLIAVVSAGLDLSWLNRLAAEAQLPPGATITVVDGRGQVLARHPRPEEYVGKLFPEAPIVGPAVEQQGEGTIEALGLDGTPRLFAFTPMRFAERGRAAYVYIGFPREGAFARVNQVDRRSLVGFILVVVLAILATRFASNLLILRPVAALVTAIGRLGAGDWRARTGLSHTRSEFGQLALSIDQLAERLEAHEAGARRSTSDAGAMGRA